jgi:hypothetical protein
MDDWILFHGGRREKKYIYISIRGVEMSLTGAALSSSKEEKNIPQEKGVLNHEKDTVREVVLLVILGHVLAGFL